MLERSLIALCLALLTLSACGAPEPQQEPTPSQTSTATPQEPASTQAATTDSPAQQPSEPTAMPTSTSAPTSVPASLPTASAQIASPALRQPTQAQGPISQRTALPTTRPSSTPIPSQIAPTLGAASSGVRGPVLVPTNAPSENSSTLPPELLNPLRADLARRTGIDITSITVVEAEAMSWSDGSLGCAVPGATYTMEPKEGFRVLLSAGGQSYDYRVTWEKQFVLCQGRV